MRQSVNGRPDSKQRKSTHQSVSKDHVSGQGSHDQLDNFFNDKINLKRETHGAVSFINTGPHDKVGIENIISKRVAILSKVPKLSPLVEKSDKFQDFFRKLCLVANPVAPTSHTST